VLRAIDRLHCAAWQNHRYRFASWRWVGLLLLGLALKVAIQT